MRSVPKPVRMGLVILPATGAVALAVSLARPAPRQAVESHRRHVHVTDSETPCGAVSLAIASQYLGRPVGIAEFRQATGAGDLGVCSIADLVRASERYGLAAAAVRYTPGAPPGHGLPMILFVNADHFLAALPMPDGRFVLIDPPGEPRPIAQALDVGSMRPGSTVEETIQLYSPDRKPFRLGAMTSDLPGVKAICEAGDAALPVHRVKVLYRASERLGPVRGALRIATDQDDAAMIDLPIVGRSTGPVLVTPTSIQINRSEIGEVVRRKLFIRAVPPGSVVRLASVAAVLPWELVGHEVRDLGAGSVALEVSLRFPMGDGRLSGDLGLGFDSPKGTEYRVPLSVRGWSPSIPSTSR